ncbi:MAG: metallophosphoesterase [Rhizobiales bacterium]|nr:metallophosphoesterase [Hyphomicrobiales bacterium]
MSFRIAHLSDAHIGPLPRPMIRELLNKRFTGYVNWRRRSHIHNMEVLGEIVADIRAHAPDHVAMTGDILNIGLPEEFRFARAWLETLGDPTHVSFVPGNHDAYVRGSLPWIVDTFGPWCSNDGDTKTSFPYLRVRGDVALIGLSSGVPTLPLLASGRVGEAQMRVFSSLLEDTGKRGLFRVVMIHHPPWQSGASFGRGLTDARAFERTVARHGAELILHGHNHRLMVRKLASPSGAVPSIGVASASAVPGTPHHRAAWHLYTVEKRGNGWSIEGRIRGLQSGERRVSDLGEVPF